MAMCCAIWGCVLTQSHETQSADLERCQRVFSGQQGRKADLSKQLLFAFVVACVRFMLLSFVFFVVCCLCLLFVGCVLRVLCCLCSLLFVFCFFFVFSLLLFVLVLTLWQAQAAATSD